MSQSDQAAAAAVVRHHELLATALGGLVTDLIQAAELGDTRHTWQVRDTLVGWLREELLPHAYAEETALYPAAARRPEARLLIDGMTAEHRAIGELVTELAETPSPVRAAAAARALQALFTAHLAKENDLVVPLLVEADDVSLADLIDGMHDLIGATAGQDGQGGCGGGGGCGCGGDAAASATAPAPVLSIDPRIDVREVPHGQRHGQVLAALDTLPANAALVLVAPHAPRPLLAEIEQRYAGQFATQWLQEGPDVWQLRLSRTVAA